MSAKTGTRLGRAAVAVACAASLATPTVAQATEPEGPEPSTTEMSEEFND